LLLDLALPLLSGHDVIAQVRERKPEVDIVVLTGLVTAEARQRAPDADPAACLVKTPKVIGAVIDTILLTDRRPGTPPARRPCG
jgi:CheY-like chemotaxis protein